MEAGHAPGRSLSLWVHGAVSDQQGCCTLQNLMLTGAGVALLHIKGAKLSESTSTSN